jgi:glycosyltransferase involved in cell wall biosynthesis
MRILFVHQNFPGQFKHLAPVLSADKSNQVVGFSMNNVQGSETLRVINYQVARGAVKETHELLREFQTKVLRADAAYRAAENLKKSGFSPDVIVAHPGWGESLFLKDVWPSARLGIYCEFYYQTKGADVGFDPEFSDLTEDRTRWVHVKNFSNIIQFESADAGISPTLWQADTFPHPFRKKISVIHDGILTSKVKPDPAAFVTINGNIRLDRDSEVITFVNRNLEPYRGYHVFMRALPLILRERPKARVVIVGGDGVSYGRAAPNGKTWKQVFLEEIRQDLDMSRVHFVGNLSYANFVRLMQISTVHVYLTYPFVLSWSLMEAMSIGCAIVASNTGPVLEVIQPNKTGVLVDFFDQQALADAVCSLIENPKLRQQLGHNAREFAIANYDLESICLPKQIQWINNLLELKASHPGP